MSTNRHNPAAIKVVCLGLGRTGTTSLFEALNILGFGPSYHMFVILAGGGKDFPAWSRIGDGNTSPEEFDAIFRGYGSALDIPTAMYPAELYAAYPNAKYILTTRDPAKWEKSMKSTILPAIHAIRATRDKSPLQEAVIAWYDTYQQGKYHRGRLETHAQEEFLAHNERVKKTIPSESLLVYEVGEGWDKLVDFLGVPKPTEPFPHVNDTVSFQEVIVKMVGLDGSEKPDWGLKSSNDTNTGMDRIGVA